MRTGANDPNDRATVAYQKTLADYEQPAIDDAVREELEDYVIRRRAELGD
jgi:trimethylamine--corrinoid protein Co-methyltransferase